MFLVNYISLESKFDDDFNDVKIMTVRFTVLKINIKNDCIFKVVNFFSYYNIHVIRTYHVILQSLLS